MLLAVSPPDSTNPGLGTWSISSLLISGRNFLCMKSLQNNFSLNTEVPVDERTYSSWISWLLVSGINFFLKGRYTACER